jgi:hypothetical protein
MMVHNLVRTAPRTFKVLKNKIKVENQEGYFPIPFEPVFNFKVIG